MSDDIIEERDIDNYVSHDHLRYLETSSKEELLKILETETTYIANVLAVLNRDKDHRNVVYKEKDRSDDAGDPFYFEFEKHTCDARTLLENIGYEGRSGIIYATCSYFRDELTDIINVFNRHYVEQIILDPPNKGK